MNQIELIAKEVAHLIRPSQTPARLGCEEYFVAAHNALSEATRDEEFSIQRFRAKMILAAAWCQLAADADSSMVIHERLRQDNLWGDEFDQKNTYNDWHVYVARYISHAMRSNAQDYQMNMVKAAAICQAAVLMIDRYGKCAPRHYERAGAKPLFDVQEAIQNLPIVDKLSDVETTWFCPKCGYTNLEAWKSCRGQDTDGRCGYTKTN